MKLEDRIPLYRRAFDQVGGDDVMGAAQLHFFAELLAADPRGADVPDDVDGREIAWGFESLALEAASARMPEEQVIDLFAEAFRIRAAGWRRDATPAPIDLWMLIVSGLGAQRQPELRLTLQRTDLDVIVREASEDWSEQVWRHCVRSLALLARKANSWADVQEAYASLRRLAELQKQHDPSHTGQRLRTELGLYHMAEALAVLGTYLRDGEPTTAAATLTRHADHAQFLLAGVDRPDVELAARTLAIPLAVMVNASIWANTSRLSQAARAFARHLAREDAETPVAELWYSQRKALRENLLDPFKAAISVEMPTSAGKTLLAELAIVQTLALNPDSTIAYVVPTRALVNQITRRLRGDLAGSRIEGRTPVVESAVPVFELDPTENSMLQARPDILVTTPEKLDLLVRSSHPSVAELSLVVVDEAHHIAEAGRGPRLELLLATLKRERAQACRFLLLTPFLPNASELAAWLGEDNSGVVRVNWKPAEQLRATARWRRRNKVTHDVLRPVPSHTQPAALDGTELFLGPAHPHDGDASRGRVSASAAMSLAHGDEGGVLVLSRGPGTAEKRAADIAELIASTADLPPQPAQDLVDVVSDYVRAELGADYPLATLLRQRVGYHHAGLPPEVRAMVELLLERRAIRVICGTSTLAQGVNFPLSAVLIETLKVPQGRGKPDRDMSFAEFWNIAGRAGRALKDPVGLVLYPVTEPKHEREFRAYLQSEAQDVVSALAEIIVGLDETQTDYGLALVRSKPALSQFLQYLAHALRVAGFDRAVAEVEEILRSSLGFFTLEQEDRDAALRLIRWSTSFLERTRGTPLLGVADVTGFSLPSVGWLSANAPAATHDPDFWNPDHLYGDDLEPLTEVVRLLAEVPELHLAPTEEEGGIDPRRVAGILRDWVVGKTLPEIADTWYAQAEGDEALRNAGRYLFRDLTGQLPWGMGALQALAGLTDAEGEAADLARSAPAMAYYGVDAVQALAMRMVGVPRAAASVIGRDSPRDFDSFAAARAWVDALPAARWREAERERGMRDGVLERIWRELGGSTA